MGTGEDDRRRQVVLHQREECDPGHGRVTRSTCARRRISSPFAAFVAAVESWAARRPRAAGAT
jgi:hypothetical protein